MDSQWSFFIEFWEILKNTFQKMFNEFHSNGKLNACIKENFVCLIPKKEDSIHVKDYRPISLTTSMYKILSKVLA